ncbi:MAG: hypothetical protein LLG40_13360 [Deltaproteobacteria bacterium]|nr:hypothetical protein [Deltaproteobacteria bacterium]
MAYTQDLVSDNLAMLKEFATASFEEAQNYLTELNDYVVATIETTPPTIVIDKIDSITIDAGVAAAMPVLEGETYPDMPQEPTTSDYAFPTAPVYSLPDVPTLKNIVLPDFIDMSIAAPTSSLPVMNFDVPVLGQILDGGLTPEDALISAAKDKLLRNILLGGTMINPQVEADLWNRDLERNEQALQDQIDKLANQWAKLEWTLPNGVLAGALAAVNNEYMNKRLDRSREIAVKQAELEQVGLFKSLEIANALEGLLIANQNDYAKRVFETSKATVDVTIELFKARITRYNTLLEAFKADMERYKIAIEAELGRVEVYKAKMQGAQILAGINELDVKIYTERIAACAQLVDLYKSGIQATATMYEAEKTKIEGYKARVDAYSSKIDAITKKYMLSVEEFKAYVQAYTASADVQTKLADLNLKGQVATVDATIKEWETQLKLIQENVTLRLEALKTVAQTSSNMVAGALSAMHIALGQSLSDSTQTVHSYQY